ncbi:MAG: formylglycine-generating enzyme family protein [Rhodospirillaceae bacterium]|nr:formylglycine-generating enzyme family protein [Rhodospirillaceae bacterium]
MLAVGLSACAATGVSAPGARFADCAECPELVVIPAGSFDMGAPPEESAGQNVPDIFVRMALPVHRVTIPRPLAVGRTEVTRGQFAAFVAATGHASDPGPDGGCNVWQPDRRLWRVDADTTWRSVGFGQDDTHPVVCVNWADANAYAAWLSQRTGHAYRLLTEAEWEYATRAGTTTARPWGDAANDACPYANGADLTARADFADYEVADCADGFTHTAPAGALRPNAFGLHDTLGNVWEWVQDCVSTSYAGAPTDGSAYTVGRNCPRIVRGGSWLNYTWRLRSGFRIMFPPERRYTNMGFRVAREVE